MDLHTFEEAEHDLHQYFRSTWPKYTDHQIAHASFNSVKTECIFTVR